MASLAEQIAALTNSAPVFLDTEDFNDDAQPKVGKVVSYDDDASTKLSTKLRRRTAGLLADEDARYAGKRVSRKKLQDEGTLSQFESPTPIKESEGSSNEMESENDNKNDNEENESDDYDEEEDESEDEENVSDVMELADFKTKLSTESIRENYSAKELRDNSDDDSEDEEEEDNGDSNESKDEDEAGEGSEEDEKVEDISKFSKIKIDEEVKKGQATKAQLTLWDQLLKARIELQKLLILVNQLPQPNTWHLFLNSGKSDYNSALSEAQGAVKILLDKIFYLQLRLLLQHPDTKSLEDDQNKKSKESKEATGANSNDEEIPSDSDMEEEVKDIPEFNLKRKHQLSDYTQLLAKRHKAFTPYRNATIQKWYDKTRVATGKLNKGFSAFEQSALKQIKQILSDRDRLVKRTQLKRSSYRILGTAEVWQEGAKEQDDDNIMNEQSKLEFKERMKEYNDEIFDDHDYYHQLLRELIERKSMNTNDPVALSRQWLELQKLRSKVKRKVDTRASKGRKIRYDILPKLVNFMAPVDTSPWTDEARDELYCSLFGKRNVESQAQ